MLKNAKPVRLRNYEKVAWVDSEDYEEILAMGDWFVLRDAGTKRPVPYVDKNINGNIQKLGLHRFLSRAPKDSIVLFLNNNPMDCRRENLLVCTRKQANLIRKLLPLTEDLLADVKE